MNEIDAPFAEEPPMAPFVTPDVTAIRAQFSPYRLPGQIGVLAGKASSKLPKSDQGFIDAFEAGMQMSVSGLLARGKAPEATLEPNPNFAARMGSNIGSLAGDLPFMIAGGVIGGGAGVPTGPGAVVTGMAGAFGLPAGLRATLMDSYTKGDFKDFPDFWNRASGIIWETIKGEITGAATAGAGLAAKAILPATASMATRAVVPTAAEIAAMTAVGHALEGQVPSLENFLDAAVVIGGLKAVPMVSRKIQAIYAKTGIPPEQVVADAARDPTIKADLTETPLEGVRAELAKSAGFWEGPKTTDIEFTDTVPSKAEQAKAYLEGRTWYASQPDIPRSYQRIAKDETARTIVPGTKTKQIEASPFAEIPQASGEPAKPTHVNYNYLNSTEDAKAALSRLSQVYEEEIQTQRRGTISWEETSNEAAKILSDTLGGIDTKFLMPREPGTPSGAAEILARKQLTIGAAEAMMGARDDLLAKGINATAQDKLSFLAAIERASLIQSEFLGARAEAGRALNILKSTAMEAERIKQIQDVIDMYGGKDPLLIAEMMKNLDNPASALKFARDATKATTYEKVVEAWKASILSGPVTHMANIMGNATFAVLRAPIDFVAAGIGSLHTGPDRVALMEPIARFVGILQGTKDGLSLAWNIMRTEEQPGKSEQFRKAIEGTKGEIIRLPFRALSAEDAVFSAMNERGELYSLATRQASEEGLNPLSREFRERIVQLVQEPSQGMSETAAEVGKRLTFNTELGERGQALQRFIRAWHLEWAIPFVRTPGNIMKELARMTPLAPLVSEWREAIKKGGAEQDKAIAEIAVGTGIASIVMANAFNGTISGSGEPDAGKRRVQQAAGWQPYSVKIGDTWYNYQRLQPLGTLVGMAADISEVWDHLNEEESDKVPKMLAVAFGNAVTNQTFLQGITNIVNALSDPKRFGPKLVQQYAGSVVPAIIAQPTQMYDPVVREIDGILDAVKARVPGLRQGLLSKRDVFGEPIETKERLGAISPVTETKVPEDKVRTEAARLGVSAADAPKKVHIGKGTGKLGDIEITPEQRNRFADVGGHKAYEILSPIVNSPSWDSFPDIAKKRIYQRAFLAAHKIGAVAALPPEERMPLVQQITEKVQAELAP